MEALADEGRIRVINTLEKRLERGWPELLPVLIEETEQCVN
jgi:V/A-type H+-transporting ATPase subunit E